MRLYLIAASATTIAMVTGQAALAQSAQDVAATNAPANAPAAAETSDAQLTDIVVTAQRREERLQDVPITVSVLNATALQNRGASAVADLPQTFPGLLVSKSSTVVQPFLRGVGNPALNPGNDPSVATYVDGIYQTNPQGLLFSFNNIERIEVLKGPQGTLFGRNATGGAIQIVTRDPTADTRIQAKVGYGRFNTLDTNAYISGGSDKIAADLAVLYVRQSDGWGTNRFPGATVVLNGIAETFVAHPDTAGKLNEFAARSKVVVRPDDNLTVKVTGYYSRAVGNQGTYRRLLKGATSSTGYMETGKFWDYTAYVPFYARTKQYGINSEVDYDMGFATVKSLSAYNKTKSLNIIQSSSSPFPTAADLTSSAPQTTKGFTQELQLLSPTGGKLEWIVGAYYLDSSAGYTGGPNGGEGLVLEVGDHVRVSQRRYATAVNKSVAGFGQATLHLGDATRLTGGIRYTHDRIEEKNVLFIGANPFIPAPSVFAVGVQSSVIPFVSTHYNSFTYRASIDHKFTPDVMVYASVNRGYKAGAYNTAGPCISSGNVGACTSIAPPVKPETLMAYEAGVKSEFLDHRVRLNLSGFYYDYKNLQVQAIASSVVGGTPVSTLLLTNAAKARLYGAEAEAVGKLTSNITLSAGLLFERTKYTSFPAAQVFVPIARGNASAIINATGNHLSRAPNFTSNVAVDWRVPSSIGEFNMNATWYHNGGFYWEASNRLREPSYNTVNASVALTLPGNHWTATAWVKNMFNEKYYSFVQGPTTGDVGAPAAPLTFGGSIAWKF